MISEPFEEALKAINTLKEKAGEELQPEMSYIFAIVSGLKSDVGQKLKANYETQEKRSEGLEVKCKEQAMELLHLKEYLRWEKKRREDLQEVNYNSETELGE
jgi:hypothetical protein